MGDEDFSNLDRDMAYMRLNLGANLTDQCKWNLAIDEFEEALSVLKHYGDTSSWEVAVNKEYLGHNLRRSEFLADVDAAIPCLHDAQLLWKESRGEKYYKVGVCQVEQSWCSMRKGVSLDARRLLESAAPLVYTSCDGDSI